VNVHDVAGLRYVDQDRIGQQPGQYVHELAQDRRAVAADEVWPAFAGFVIGPIVPAAKRIVVSVTLSRTRRSRSGNSNQWTRNR
jgi:hypothetical protein